MDPRPTRARAVAQYVGAAVTSLLLISFSGRAQVNTPSPQSAPSVDEKAQQILERAIQVLGGSSYLNISTATGRGLYTPYKDGVSQLPAKFVDYIAYPDKERTEFAGGGARVIQANFGEQGWVFDGAAKTLHDMKAEQVEDFKLGMRTSVENLLRGWWRKENCKLYYVGRREAGLAKRNETIRLTYPDGFWIEYEFGAKDGLPAKILYNRKRKNANTDELEDVAEEDLLLQFLKIEGILTPFVVDHFTAGTQRSRINYESIQYNSPLPDSLFTKPATIKGLK